MQAELGLNQTREAFPSFPEEPSLHHPDLVVLQSERIWCGDEKFFPDLYGGNAGFEFADHPLKCNIAQSRFILRIAAAHIAVAAGKPNLFEPFRLFASIFLHCTERHPSDAGAIGPVFINPTRVALKADSGRKPAAVIYLTHVCTVRVSHFSPQAA